MPATQNIPYAHRAALLLGAILCTAVTAAAQNKPPPIDPALRARFGFLDPIIKKLGWGTNMPQVVQWQKNGGRNVLVNNPHRARLDDLHLVKGTVKSTTIRTDGDLHGLATADVDGDGIRDILWIYSRGRLVVQLRGGDKKRLPEIEVGRGKVYDCLHVHDIDGDGSPDAIVLTRDGLRTVRNLRTKPVVSATTPLFANNLRAFHVFDVDRDGHVDVVLCATGEKMQVQLKLGDGKGSFGPWILVNTPSLYSLFPGTGITGATLAAIRTQPRRVVEYRLDVKDGADRPALFLEALPTTSTTRAFVHGDVDNDGDLDLVVADPQRARLTFFLETDGRFVIRHAPTLAGVHCLAIGDVDGDGKNDLVMTSLEESALSYVSSKAGLTSFPKPLARLPQIARKDATPIAVAIGDGKSYVLGRSKSYNAQFFRVFGAGREARVEPCSTPRSMRRDPRRLLLTDLDGRNGADIAFVAPNDGLKVFFQSAKSDFEPPAKAGQAGFTKRMDDGALSLTGSGAERALLAVRERYTRSFRFDETGQPVILSQDNGPDGIPSMALGTVMADGSRLYLDRKNNRLYRTAADRPTVSIDVPSIGATHLLPHGKDALLLGRTGVLRVPFGRSYELTNVRSHEPPTQKTRYYRGHAADLDGDGKRELALLDSHLHGMHILVPQGDKLRRGVSFPIFESTDDSSQEPRTITTGDVNRDGLQDLLLLAHDRILIYFQER